MTEIDSAVNEQAAVTSETFPWPPPPGESWLDAIGATWTQACFHPASFFRRMPRADDYGVVILYYVIVVVASEGIRLFWSTLFRRLIPNGTFLQTTLGTAQHPLVDFLLSPFFGLLLLYLVTAVCHGVLLMTGAGKHGSGTSSRVFAFAVSPSLFVVVPFVGTIAGFFWMVVIAIIGLREAHETTTGKAAVSVIVPLFLLFCLVVLTVMVAAVMGVLKTPI